MASMALRGLLRRLGREDLGRREGYEGIRSCVVVDERGGRTTCGSGPSPASWAQWQCQSCFRLSEARQRQAVALADNEDTSKALPSPLLQ